MSGMTKDPFNCRGKGSKNAQPGFSRRTLLRSGGLVLALHAARPRRWNLLAESLDSSPSAPAGCFATSRTAYPPQLESLIAKLDPALDDFPTEQYVEQLEKILAAWSAALCHSIHDLRFLRGNLDETLVATSFPPSETIPLRTHWPLLIERRVFQAAQTNNRDKFAANFAAYLASFTKLELAELEICGIRVVGEHPLRVETDIRCDLVGPGEKGSREQRVGSWVLNWSRDDQINWSIQRWTANAEIRSRLTGPGFSEITSRCLAADVPGMAQLLPGIDHWRTALDGAAG